MGQLFDYKRLSLAEGIEVQADLGPGTRRLVGSDDLPGGGTRVEAAFARIEGGNLREGRVEELSHSLGAAIEDDFERIAARQGQPYLGPKSGQARLLECSDSRRAFALNGIADTPLQRLGMEVGFDQIIGGAEIGRASCWVRV